MFISHRLSSVQSADWVYLLSDGTVKEAGTHRMLMEKGGIYADMYAKQAKNYLAITEEGDMVLERQYRHARNTYGKTSCTCGGCASAPARAL